MLHQNFLKFAAAIYIGLLSLSSLSYAQLDSYQTIQPTDKINFTFYDENNKKCTLNDYIGKIVIVNMWATWCAPCVAEMPSLNEIAESFPDDVVILTMLKDKKLTETAQKQFKSKDFKKFVLCYDQNGEITNQLKVKGLPTTFIINRQGYLIGKQVGGIDWDHYAVLDLIKAYVEGKAATPPKSLINKFMSIFKVFSADE